ncbi:MAG: hypothetical protein NTY35_04195 [Planctomycetota bacterium]|nr:hypothetical protein [Planctomycetota bacterium]
MMSKFLTGLLVASAAFGLGSQANAGSLDKPGSLLLFPYFNNSRGQTSFLTVTNTNNNFNQVGSLFAGTVDVEFVYIDGESCLEFNRTRRLTPNDTITVSTQLDNPNDPRGYVYVFAKSPTTGQAISWNYLEGDSILASSSDNLNTNLSPIVYRAIAADGVATDAEGDGVRDMDGVEYEANADELHIPRFISDPNSSIILIGLTGLKFTTIVSYLAYNDNEEAFSGQASFDCWDFKKLSVLSGIFTDSFLESTNDNALEEVNGYETGWIRMTGQTAFSTAQQRSNPAFMAVRVDEARNGSLPYGIGTNPNGDLLPLGPFGDNTANAP